MKFEWEQQASERAGINDRDQVYVEIIRNYYDLSSAKNTEIWNLIRKRVVTSLLSDYIIPNFMR